MDDVVHHSGDCTEVTSSTREVGRTARGLEASHAAFDLDHDLDLERRPLPWPDTTHSDVRSDVGLRSAQALTAFPGRPKGAGVTRTRVITHMPDPPTDAEPHRVVELHRGGVAPDPSAPERAFGRVRGSEHQETITPTG
jgi:hypothetical protein